MDSVIAWLLEGDVSIQYMTHRFLLCSNADLLMRLKERIALEGFGARLLSRQSETGHWGLSYYQPKWTSTHYTLLDLKNLCAPETLRPCRDMAKRMFHDCMLENGGLNLSRYEHASDVCVDGMALNYASYFCSEEPRLDRLVSFLLAEQKPDGGFTWDLQADSGDPHTTICVLEGFVQYSSSVGRETETLRAASGRAIEFLLKNGLFMQNADPRFRKLAYPYRYRFDLLRILEFFATERTAYDPRMRPAIAWLIDKQKSDGLWYLEHQHKGNVHFVLEEIGKPSRLITLKALLILEYFRQLSDES
ncbi:MAG: hypothetical protein LLF75_12545 [Eubacteriales bacterium]|nr:hypothetical protein [Eubacteriales bacterium]